MIIFRFLSTLALISLVKQIFEELSQGRSLIFFKYYMNINELLTNLIFQQLKLSAKISKGFPIKFKQIFLNKQLVLQYEMFTISKNTEDESSNSELPSATLPEVSPQIIDEEVPSEFKPQYQQATTSHEISEETLKSMEIKLLKNGIEIDRRYFQPNLRAELVNFTSNFQALHFRVSFGYFKMLVSILNVQSISQCHNFLQIHQSSNSSLFLFQGRSGKKHSIKCLQIKANFMAENISWVIREICIFRIASVLEIGPKMSDLLGFDAIIYGNCIEFAMECCQKVGTVSTKQIQLLTKKLSLLHQFNLVHIDIKPSNIMFSPSLQEIVYIDFGLSKHIEQKIGFKTKVKFSGSLSFCGKQMRKAYETKLPQYVDLYYNDIICLKNSLNQLSQTLQQEIQESEQNKRYEQNELALIILMHYEKYYKIAALYFTFIKVKFYIFSNLQFQKKILNSQQFMRKYYFALTDFVIYIADSRYRDYIGYMFEDLMKENGLKCVNIDYRLRFQFSNRTKQLSFISQQNTQQTYFIQILKSLLNSQGKQLCEGFYLITKENKKKSWLLQPQLVKQVKNKPYLIRCYAEFVDFRKAQTTFQQKVTASVIISKILNINLSSDLQENEVLSLCQKTLLIQLTEAKPAYYEELIPILLRNLLILNAITCQEIVFLIRKILGQSIDSNQKFKLKIKLEIILLLFNEQNFEYYDPIRLQQMFQELYEIKVEQPYSTALQHLSDRVMQNKFRIYSYMKITVKKLFQKIYFQDNFIDQVIMWKFAHFQAGLQMSIKSYQTFYWLRLQLICAYDSKYDFQFDFYYFPLMYFPNVDLSAKIIKYIYGKLSRCVQKEAILKQFVVYYFYWGKQIRKETSEKQLIFFSQLATQLISRYVSLRQKLGTELNLNFLIDKREHKILSEVFYFCVKNQTNQIAHNMLLSLNIIITYDILKKIPQTLKNTSNYSNLYKNSIGSVVFTLICFYYWNIYKDEPRLLDQLQQFCNQIKDQLSSVDFTDKLMLIHFEYSLLTIQTRALQLQNQTEKKIQCYQSFLLKNLAQSPLLFINSDFFNRPFILYVYNCMKISPQTKGKQALQFYYETVIKYKQMKTLFALQKFQQSFNYLNGYLILYKDIDHFLDFQLNLCCFLQSYPYQNYTKDYIKSFQFFQNFDYQQHLRQCWDQLQNKLSYVWNGSNYIILFFSFLLKYFNISHRSGLINPMLNKKIMVFITQRVQKVNINAKYYTLSHLYCCLYFFNSTRLTYNKNYLKYNLQSLSFCEVKKAMKFKSPYNRNQKGFKFKFKLEEKVKSYHVLINH